MLSRIIQAIKRSPFFLPARQVVVSLVRLPAFFNSLLTFQKLTNETRNRRHFVINMQDLLPCLDDNTSQTGFDPHYLYHISWACRCVKALNPAKHVDISSHVYFASTLSAFIPVDFYDYRPSPIKLSNLVSGAADLLELPFADNSIESLSCMHVVEHIGLGRYGDPLDPEGDLKAVAELKRVLAPGGSLLFVVPVGRSRLMFNGHRIYSFAQIESMFAGLELKECALIPDDFSGGIVANANPGMIDAQEYGCGLFRWQKGK